MNKRETVLQRMARLNDHVGLVKCGNLLIAMKIQVNPLIEVEMLQSVLLEAKVVTGGTEQVATSVSN